VPEALRRPLAALFAAIAFLTRVPAPARLRGGAEFADAAVLFPLVGAVIGAAVGGAAAVLEQPLGPLVAATLAVGLELVLTGALHLDGLADTFDGLAGRDPAHRLAIMRDHSLGTYGAAALVIDLFAKVAALATLAELDALWPVVAAFAVARAAPLPLAAALPYARSGSGTGRTLADSLHAPGAAAGVALAALLAGAATGLEALGALAALAAVVLAAGAASRRALGGVTGDVMGAAIELTGTLALCTALATQ
jgi:adenosylcobinamide-GDP ribazoletransferase